MLISKAQFQLFFRLWSAACKAQGWTTANGLTAAQINEHRLRILRECGFTSLKLVTKVEGFNKVKQALQTLAGNIDGPLEADNPHMELGRRDRWVIVNRILPKLARHVADPLAYARKIAFDKFPHLRREGGAAAPWDLAHPHGRTFNYRGRERVVPSELKQLLMTLNRAADALEKKAVAATAQGPCEAPAEALETAGDPY